MPTAIITGAAGLIGAETVRFFADLRINDARYADQIEEGRRFVSSEIGSDGRLVYLGFSNPISKHLPPAATVARSLVVA